MFPLQDHPRLLGWSVPREWEHRSWRAAVVAQWGLCDRNCVLYPHACALSTGSRRHNSDQEDWCLPPPALEPGQTAANDGGDHGQRQGAGPHRAHLLAIHERRTGAEAQVILPLLGCSGFWLSPGHLCCPLGPASLSGHWPGSQMSTLIQVRLLTRSWACVTQACYLRESARKVHPNLWIQTRGNAFPNPFMMLADIKGAWMVTGGNSCLLSRDRELDMVLDAAYLISHLILPLPVRWTSQFSFSSGGGSGSESCSLLIFTPVGDDPVRIWFPICLMPWFLHYFPLIWIIVFFVTSQWSSFSLDSIPH